MIIFQREKQDTEANRVRGFFKNVVFADTKTQLVPVSFMRGIKK